MSIRILGIDPGLRNTGFAVVELINQKPYYIMSGVIKSDNKLDLPSRIKSILQGLDEVIKSTNPTVACIEKVFVNVNPSSTLLLGQARGAAISACVLANLDVYEYTALQIKQAVVGYGHATKVQIQQMVRRLLNLDGTPSSDAADAIACCLSHIEYTRIATMFETRRVRGGRSL